MHIRLPILVIVASSVAGTAFGFPPPDNDNVFARSNFSGVQIAGSNVDATSETNEPNHAGASAGKSVWFMWTSPNHPGTMELSTAGSSFDTVLAVYTDPGYTTMPAAASLVVSSNDYFPDGTSRVTFRTPLFGAQYLIALDGDLTGLLTEGDFVLTGHFTPDQAPGNDNIANALSVNIGSLLDSFNYGATSELNEPDHASSSAGKSIWYKSSFIYAVKVSTAGSAIPTILAAYTGTPGSLMELDSDVDVDGSGASITIQPGGAFYIAVDSVEGSGHTEGPIKLTISETATIDSMYPISDTDDGGVKVTLLGQFYTEDGWDYSVRVLFGDVPNPAQILSYGSSFIECLAPQKPWPYDPVVVTVEVTRKHPFTSEVQVYTGDAPGLFTYGGNCDLSLSPPGPSAGSTAGGAIVTMQGHGIATNTNVWVEFGGVPATGKSITKGWDGVYSLRCIAPPHAPGTVDVVVRNGCNVVQTMPDAFTYFDPLPAIESIDPLAGTSAGGTAITLAIANWTEPDPPTVMLGDAEATQVSLEAGQDGLTLVHCTSGTHLPGWVDVTVQGTAESAERMNGFAYISSGANTVGLPDNYEVDDEYEDRTSIQMFANEHETQARSFHKPGDIDWIALYAPANVQGFEIKCTSPNADPVIEIFDYNLQLIVPETRVSDGDPNTSDRFDLPSGYEFFVRIRNANPSGFGNSYTYSFSWRSFDNGPTLTGYLTVSAVDALTGRALPNTAVSIWPISTPGMRVEGTTTYSGVLGPIPFMPGTFTVQHPGSIAYGLVSTQVTLDSSTSQSVQLSLIRNTSPFLQVTSPANGENLIKGNQHTIQWSTTGLVESVNLTLFKGANQVSQLAAGIANTGQFQWNIPANLSNGSDYRIRVEYAHHTATFDDSEPFVVGDPLGMSVTGNPSPVSHSPGQFDLDVEQTGLGTLAWSASVLPGAPWLTIQSGANGSGDGVITVEHESNTSTSQRQGTVRVSAPGATPSAIDITITQQGRPLVNTLTVLSPNGGEQWQQGEAYDIEWASGTAKSIANVTIELWASGALHTTIAASTPNDGLYHWSVPANLPLGSAYRIRVIDTANGTVHDASDADFSVIAPPLVDTLSVTSPNGGEQWTRGSQYTIQWTAGVAKAISNVKLELLSNGSLHTMIAASTANDGAHAWTVPTSVPAGNAYSIRVSDTSNASTADTSDHAFTILDLPPVDTLTVTSPNGGETWYRGSAYEIAWTTSSSKAVSLVNIILLKNGVPYTGIAAFEFNSGTFQWSVPGNLELGTDYTIRVSDSLNGNITDDSNAPLSIADAPAPPPPPPPDPPLPPDRKSMIQKVNASIAETVLPPWNGSNGVMAVAAGQPVYVRLFASAPIVAESIWAQSESTDFTIEWIPSSSESDGWVKIAPDGTWPHREPMHVTVGAKTQSGLEIESEKHVIQSASMESPPSIPLPDVWMGVPVSAMHQIDPIGAYASPVVVQVPLHRTVDAGRIAIMYYSESHAHQGWYPGSSVRGWMADPAVAILESPDGLVAEFAVMHSGVVQAVEVPLAIASGVPGFDVRITGPVQAQFGLGILVFLAMAGIAGQWVAYRRHTQN
ncbi:MAG: hypothetical protein AMXMBFR84_24650 [Candidatus Hydrogenedentota bacterium]